MSWEQLQAIIAGDRTERAFNDSQPPVACPIDGEILEIRGNDTRNCPLGNYTYPS